MSLLNDIYEKVKDISDKIIQIYSTQSVSKSIDSEVTVNNTPSETPSEEKSTQTTPDEKSDTNKEVVSSVKDLNLGTLFSGVQKAAGMFVKLIGMLQTQTMETVIDEPYSDFKEKLLSYDAPVYSLGSTDEENKRIQAQMSENFARFQNTSFVNQTAFMNIAASSPILNAPGYKPDVIQKNIDNVFFTLKADDIATLKSYAEQLSKASKNFQLYPNGR